MHAATVEINRDLPGTSLLIQPLPTAWEEQLVTIRMDNRRQGDWYCGVW